MAARRNKRLPYEVMGQTPAQPGERASGWPPPMDTQGDTVDLDANAADESTGSAGGGFLNWRGRTAQPIRLLLPRGYALVLLAVFAGLAVLSYWAGRHRGWQMGYEAGYAQREQELADEAALRRSFGADASDSVAREPAAGASWSPGSAPSVEDDPRVDGRNYFVVCLYPEDEARRAAAFLRSNGVDCMVIPGHNTRFYEVIALRGFEQMGREAEAFKDQLKRLGRLWKQQHRGPDDFSPYARKYRRG